MKQRVQVNQNPSIIQMKSILGFGGQFHLGVVIVGKGNRKMEKKKMRRRRSNKPRQKEADLVGAPPSTLPEPRKTKEEDSRLGVLAKKKVR